MSGEIFKSPERKEPGDGKWPFRCSIPEIGVNFVPFYVRDYFKLLAYWDNGNDRHVYEITMRPKEGGGWRAVCLNDGREIVALEGASKWHVLNCVQAAMRAYLWRNHRRTVRKLKAEKGGE